MNKSRPTRSASDAALDPYNATRASRLVPGLLALQTLVSGMVALNVAAFAPRLLLLDDTVVVGSTPLLLYGGAAWFLIVISATVFVTRRIRPALKAMITGGEIEATEILAMYALPARLVTVGVVAALLMSIATLFPPVRPETNDLHTQVEIVTLTMTFTSVAALPFYVMVRARVARVLELLPAESTREAIELLEANPSARNRARQRLSVAVVAPVGFVAIGAALLVHAHVRAFDISSRENDAAHLARGVLETVNGSNAGRKEAAEAAASHGYVVDLSRAGARFGATRDDKGDTVLRVPMEDGHAVIKFDTARIDPGTGIYFLLALLATAIAGLLGARIGSAYAADLQLATRELRTIGALDVIRGTRIQRDARFRAVGELTHAIDELGGVFREFAAAQERAIDARSAAERMRGLFLASMSHDLKAPLNAILGFAELVSRNDLTEGQRESVTIIEQRGRELLHLIDTILDAARAEAGELSITPEPTMVGDVVMSAVLDARELTQGQDVRIIGEIQPGVPRMFVDATRVVQALTAIVLVAARFTDKSTISVRATLPAAGDRLQIDVETTGRGLPAQEREKLFEAFKHADRARRHGSLGLGPSLARSIITLHGGSLDVDTTEGGGVIFHVWLPAVGDRVSQPPAWSQA